MHYRLAIFRKHMCSTESNACALNGFILPRAENLHRNALKNDLFPSLNIWSRIVKHTSLSKPKNKSREKYRKSNQKKPMRRIECGSKRRLAERPSPLLMRPVWKRRKRERKNLTSPLINAALYFVIWVQGCVIKICQFSNRTSEVPSKKRPQKNRGPKSQ